VLVSGASDAKQVKLRVGEAIDPVAVPVFVDEVGDQAGERVMSALVGTGRQSVSVPDWLETQFFGVAQAAKLADIVDFGLGFTENNAKAARVSVDAEFRAQSDGRISTIMSLFSTDGTDNSDWRALKDLARRAELEESLSTPARMLPTLAAVASRRVAARMALEVPAGRPDSTTATAAVAAGGLAAITSVLTSRTAAAIPRFVGVVYRRAADITKNSEAYLDGIEQYARSSLTPAQRVARMMPHMVAYPENVADVVAAVSFAAANAKKVVARSGGHHYSGLSSGGDDTILLSMDKFDSVVFGVDATVEVGVGVRLKTLSTALRTRQLSIPHGECPLVGIGGHVQTGGLGHMMHSYGLALDHCVQFEMITADGAVQTYRRGNPVYAAVLGGGPGSFGVLTKLRFQCVKDATHPRSYGFRGVWLYSKGVLEAAFEAWRQWTVGAQRDDLPPGTDLAITVVSAVNIRELLNLSVPRPAAVLVEALSLETQHVAYLNSITQPIKDASWLKYISVDGPSALSDTTDSAVRTQGIGTTHDGREFAYPFKKRVVVFRKAMTAEFKRDFVTLVDDSMNAGLKVVVQVLAGGGKYRNPPAGRLVTRAQFRDLAFALVFDVFYFPNDAGRQRALQAQAAMRALMTKHSIEDLRMFWGSYEENDNEDELALDNVADKYYDDPDTYPALRDIKRQIDPSDVFHTSFTVQLPAQQ
jgi:FAD/FMN-containing dehydrogenase